MKSLSVFSVCVIAASEVQAQDNFPPVGQIVQWRVSRGVSLFTSCPFNPLACPTAPFPGPPPFDLGEFVVYDANDPSTSLADIANFKHTEFDLISVRINVFDADWSITLADLNAEEVAMGEPPPDTPDYEEVFIRVTSHGTDGPPEGTPFPIGSKITPLLISETDTVLLMSSNSVLGVFEGPITPSKGFAFGSDPATGPVAVVDYFFLIPQFIGRNQDRLDGGINYDVAYNFLLALANEEEPATINDPIADFDPRFGPFVFSPCEDAVICQYVAAIMRVVSNPLFDPTNPPPIADAAVSARMVAVGTEVTLDGSRSFDSSNEGFDTSSDTIFERDILTYAWEWTAGPVRVDPVQDVPTNPKATVVLDEVGIYRYRLLVEDGASGGLPSIASVEVTVVADLSDNQPPIVSISGPAGPVALGNEVTLDASASIDPDGDALKFRWRQVNALGEPIRSDELQGVFQGLSGVDTSIATWQALAVGQFFFRLLVDDGEFVSSATFAISVIDTATAGITIQAAADAAEAENGAAANPTDDTAEAAPANPACGGGLFPLVAVPFALVTMRRRRLPR